jgi:membrane protease YdiL (CAAX protease family)
MIEPPPRPDLTPSGAAPVDAPTGAMRDLRGMKGRPPARWSFWEGLGIFLLGNVVVGQLLVAGVILVIIGVDQVSTTGAAGTPELAATLGADVATVVVIWIWLSRRWRDWVTVLGFGDKATRVKDVLIGIAMGPVVYAGVALIAAIVLSAVLGAISGHDATTPDQIDVGSLSSAGKLLTIVVAVLVAPITEELAFRGVIFRSLRDRRGFWLGAIVSSLMFGLVHFVPAPWQDTVLLQVTMVFTGFALALIYEWRGNLLVCILTHMSFNAIGVTLILAIR